MSKSVRTTSSLFFIVALFLASALLPMTGLAHESQASQDQEIALPTRQPAAIDPAELEAFLDGWIAERMEQTPLYGLGLVMVSDGETAFARWYGADPLTGETYDIDTTVVRVASVAKLFTATAAMQLYDQGLIDLHDNVNDYLTATQLDDTFPQPITFHHLLTHTDGFERWFLALRPLDAESLISLEEFYATRRARRILPPGQMITYDNYASGLLGYLIEQVSGLSFTDYMGQNIFGPLGMDSSTFVQPPPPEFEDRTLAEYEYDDDKGEYVPAALRLSHLSPAGGMHASLVDMGHFLVAMVGDGSYDGGRILSQDTVQMMYPQRFTTHPRMPGTTYGLLEDFTNGHRVLRRDGDSTNAWSRIYLMPDQGTGIFLTAIGDEATRVALSEALFDRFYPRSEPLPAASGPADLDRYRGTYHPVSDHVSTFGKTIALFMGNIRVTPNDDGTLALQAMGRGDVIGGFEGTTTWLPVGDDAFIRSDGRGIAAFGADEDGSITHLYSGQKYMGNYRKLAWYEGPTLHTVLLGVFVVVFLSAAVSWGLVPLLQALRRKPGPAGDSRWGTVIAGLDGTLNALFSILWLPAIFLIGMRAGEPAPGYGINTLTKFVLALPLITTPLTLALVYFSWQAWKQSYWSLARRLHYTLLTITALGLIVWTHYWNLLGFRF